MSTRPKSCARGGNRVLSQYRQPLGRAVLEQPQFTVTAASSGNGGSARVLGVCILLRPQARANVYSLHNKELCEDLVTYVPADDAEAGLAGMRALQAYRALECRDTARIDFRSDAMAEQHFFLEANPLAGLHPVTFGSADPGGASRPSASSSSSG